MQWLFQVLENRLLSSGGRLRLKHSQRTDVRTAEDVARKYEVAIRARHGQFVAAFVGQVNAH